MKTKCSFIDRKFFSFLLTSSIEMVVTYILLLSDTIIAGWSIGESAVSAVNIVTPVFSAIAFFSILISTGAAFSFSFEIGNFNKERANEFFGQGVIMAIAIGMIMLLVTILGKNLYFSVLSPSADVLGYAKGYYMIYPFIALLYPIFCLLSSSIYADGDDLICNISNLTQIFGNIIFSLILSRFFGITGISLGTLIGIISAIIVLLFHFRRKQCSLAFEKHFSVNDAIHIFRFGATDGAQYICSSIMLYVVNGFVISKFGSDLLPVVTVVSCVIEMTIIFDGIGESVSPLLSVFFAEKNNPGIRSLMRTAKFTAISEGLIFSVFLFIFAGKIPGILGITDKSVISQCIPAIRITASTLIFSALEYLLTSYFIIQNRVLLPVIITAIYFLFTPVSLGILLASFIGINGLWIGMACAPILAILIGSVIVMCRYGKTAVPLILDPANDNGISSYDIMLTPENTIKMRDDIECLLRKCSISDKTIYRIMLLIEELCTLITEQNPGKKIYCECTIKISDSEKQIKIIMRDSGKIFNITDSDMEISSLNAFVVSSMMEKYENRKNLTTMGYNRNEFLISDSEG